MLSLFWKSISTVLFPGGLIFLVAIGFLRPQGHPMWLQQPIAAIPYIVLAFGLIFGWYFASSRMILSLVVLALADQALVLLPNIGGDQESVRRTIVAITAFLVPLNLLAFSILKEDSLSTFRGVTRVVLVLIQPFLLLWLCLPDQHVLASSFTKEYIPSRYVEWTPIPQPALADVARPEPAVGAVAVQRPPTTRAIRVAVPAPRKWTAVRRALAAAFRSMPASATAVWWESEIRRVATAGCLVSGQNRVPACGWPWP